MSKNRHFLAELTIGTSTRCTNSNYALTYSQDWRSGISLHFGITDRLLSGVIIPLLISTSPCWFRDKTS
jgi:hypothetical protein